MGWHEPYLLGAAWSPAKLRLTPFPHAPQLWLISLSKASSSSFANRNNRTAIGWSAEILVETIGVAYNNNNNDNSDKPKEFGPKSSLVHALLTPKYPSASACSLWYLQFLSISKLPSEGTFSYWSAVSYGQPGLLGHSKFESGKLRRASCLSPPLWGNGVPLSAAFQIFDSGERYEKSIPSLTLLKLHLKTTIHSDFDRLYYIK